MDSFFFACNRVCLFFSANENKKNLKRLLCNFFFMGDRGSTTDSVTSWGLLLDCSAAPGDESVFFVEICKKMQKSLAACQQVSHLFFRTAFRCHTFIFFAKHIFTGKQPHKRHHSTFFVLVHFLSFFVILSTSLPQ